MRNIKNGLIDELAYDVWMIDIDMCQPVSWLYKEGMGIKYANLIIDILSMELLGSSEKIDFAQNPMDLKLNMPVFSKLKGWSRQNLNWCI